ncbi:MULTISPECIES: SDR family oxidoreductase [unclassified Burkholderia]|uniref:SDR family oxidoreductase n=1 Tax=unclassified Burkholderia TaxID=2613784 RepID=UPI001422CF9B|nr:MULTISPECIES: SDR family oxidoreductase [unclassified Burkholderia]NIE83337.1 NAD-dependent epimerase/dehydratase family protein [Burkholderia sp. Tr-860]NIF62253.1 NAD-dependent epimerase/dehydratase family protein [Burkholderia sp. Cy-647]NIF70300.1 NAD-dependent epimerase/dehydratase family protein [Burkholderia sp. Ap-962]NIF87277.1 NAD-dependent epimerase/dehydratase family protein [Burkholderia sp. Cy-637]NIF94475.1 NAD-dependent epimerase/dehydratase family protein [Burkholderia sp. 
MVSRLTVQSVDRRSGPLDSAPWHATALECLVLTGATGFIGGTVLVTLVNAGIVAPLLCLVRAADRAEALSRLRASAVRCGLRHELAQALTEANVIVGELGDDFPESDLARLRAASHVINCAAMASFSANPQILSTNVEDTLRFASRFDNSRTLRRFLHVGTAMACGTQCDEVVSESTFSGQDATHLVPYTRSKRDVEQRLRLQNPELPLVVARPSIVVGHTSLGTSASASIYWVFRIVHAARRFTASPDSRLDIVSVDDCARALISLSFKARLEYDVYHISAGPNAASIEQIIRAMDKAAGTAGTRYSVCTPRELKSIARELAQRQGKGVARLIEQALKLYAGFAGLNYRFDNRRLCQEIGFSPLPFVDYVQECIRTSEQVGILEQMRWDFK